MLGEMTIEDAALDSAGNWEKFDSFIWYGRPEDAKENPKSWALFYTHNRDSGCLDKSNGEEFAQALAPFADGDNPDVIFQTHNHCLVGHIDGFAVRVYRDGEITEAFRAYHSLCEKLAKYSVLNETRHGELQAEEIAESWEAWARQEFERELEKRFRVSVRDGIDLRPLWDSALETGSGQWIEESSGMFIDVPRMVKGIAFDDARPYLDCELLPERIEQAARLLAALHASSEFHSICAAAGLGSIQFFGLQDDLETIAKLPSR